MWNDRYSGAEYFFGTEPAAFLAAAEPYLAPGCRVLLVADGEGRNSAHLAAAGHDVTAFDFAENGVAKARALAERRGVSVAYHQGDILAWDWDATAYDAVIAIFIQFLTPQQQPEVFAGMVRALRPGGLLMLHGYAPRQVEYATGGPPWPEHMYTLPRLRSLFAGLEELRAEDYDAHIEEGTGHSGLSGLVDFIARKPAV